MMFEYLAPFRVVIATGPMRSGTTICAHMIAEDTGKAYLDDLANGIGGIRELCQAVGKAMNTVVQCPIAFPSISEFGGMEDVAIVVMRRDIDEIITSGERMGLKRDRYSVRELYANWDTCRSMILHSFEVNYSDLRSHPLWVNKDKRTARNGWSVKTWRLAVAR